MATVNIVNCPIGVARNTTGLPSTIDTNYSSITVISSGSSAPVAITAKDYGTNGGAWVITVTGNSVFVKFGRGTPVATDQDILILDGQTREFWARPGDTVAIVDLSI